jgi:hypothetical protein
MFAPTAHRPDRVGTALALLATAVVMVLGLANHGNGAQPHPQPIPTTSSTQAPCSTDSDCCSRYGPGPYCDAVLRARATAVPAAEPQSVSTGYRGIPPADATRVEEDGSYRTADGMWHCQQAQPCDDGPTTTP